MIIRITLFVIFNACLCLTFDVKLYIGNLIYRWWGILIFNKNEQKRCFKKRTYTKGKRRIKKVFRIR